MAYPSFLITLTAKENNPNNVTIAFTLGTKSLDKGHDSTIMLLSDAVHLCKTGYVDTIDIGAPFSPVKDVLQQFLEKGGQIVVCSACMEHNGISKEDDLINNIKIINADEVIDYITNAKSTLQLNG